MYHTFLTSEYSPWRCFRVCGLLDVPSPQLSCPSSGDAPT